MTEANASGSSADDIDLSGRILGDFRILRRLGRGAMAEVYLAEQTSLRRQVAVKVLSPQLACDASYIERFRREAQAAAALVHANIVQVYEVGQANGLHYIAQEYVSGQNLKEFYSRSGPLREKQALQIMIQVASALAKAASQGIVHRDIKPENIMLSKTGEVKVADFGLARAADAALNLTQTGVTLGTPLYMSPEQVEGRPLDPRSDLYSLGVSCYHMLAGRPPFQSETALAVAIQHLKSEPEPLSALRPDLSPRLCGIIMRLLAKDANHRPPTARDLLRELQVLAGTSAPESADWDTVDSEAAQAPQIAPLHAATQRLQSVLSERHQLVVASAQHRRLRWSALVVLCGLGAGIALGFWLREPFLLANSDPLRTHVEKRSTAIDQLLQASALNTEEGWLSVREYFPGEEFYAHLADQQLARLYLHQNDYDRARLIFERFADLDDSEESFRAFGLAGLCVVNSFEGNPKASAEALNRLYDLRSHLDPQMARLVQLAIQRNQQAMNPAKVSEWEQWFTSQEPEDSESRQDQE